MHPDRVTTIGNLGHLDRRIVAALQLNGRATWKQVAAAVGATESTVARRGQQLLDARGRRGHRGARPPALRPGHLPAGAAALPTGHRERRRRGARRAGGHPVRRGRHRQRRRGRRVRRAAPPRRRRRARRRVAPAGRHRRDRGDGRRAQVLGGGGVGHRPARAGRGRAPAPRRRPVGPPRVARARAAQRAGVRDREGARRRRPGVATRRSPRPWASATRRRHAGWSHWSGAGACASAPSSRRR